VDWDFLQQFVVVLGGLVLGFDVRVVLEGHHHHVLLGLRQDIKGHLHLI